MHSELRLIQYYAVLKSVCTHKKMCHYVIANNDDICSSSIQNDKLFLNKLSKMESKNIKK